MSNQLFTMKVDGETITWKEKSHAQIFRNFWQYFMGKNLQKTIKIIELVGIRTSNSPFFESINGSKKKNIFVTNDLYIYTHLTPAAMQRVYTKFISGWELQNDETLNTEFEKKTVLNQPQKEEYLQVFEMTVDGETITWEEKSHAQIFRNFWQYFMRKDLQKTIKIIELVGIRTSNSPFFESINGSKKKNIFVTDDYYVYTHLTPAAMQKLYTKFISGWEQQNDGTLNKEFEKTINHPQETETPKLKNIYKKSLAMDLVRAGHDLHHTMRNRENSKYQVFVFEDTPKLIEDLLKLTKGTDVVKKEKSITTK
ncbi:MULTISPECIES: hypothetical protein [Bacillus]|uniref:hypothetical protein n=1 Tax=Bacillus TaxID=1386 RepID=UPI0021B5E575|nr:MULTISPECIES: hypothetical protein [Bacillus]MDC7973548.1 hypothetical protein [Bacillus sp. BLCC-B18]